jgi:ubiquinone biosynthesis protein
VVVEKDETKEESVEMTSQVSRNRRLRQIVQVFTKYGLAGSVKDSMPDSIKKWFVDPDGHLLSQYSRAERLRMALSELGTTFIKFGQVLSTRDDLLDPPFIEALKTLQADTPPDPPDTVRAILEEELGQPVEELYTTFDFEALGSASVGQVHAATLRDGTEVVVKLIHAGIEETVRMDLELMVQGAGLLDKRSDLPFQPSDVIADFRRQLLRELDLQQEQRNLNRFINNFADDPAVIFPRPYPELSTSRVLTMDRLEGISLNDYQALVADGVDLAESTRHGANVWVEMIFRDRFYHADPHPGNLLLLPGGAAGILDCGMIGRIDKRMSVDLEDLALAYVSKDAGEIASVVLRICDPPRGCDRKGLEADIGYIVDDLLDRPVEQIDVVELSNAILGAVRHYHLNIPSSYIMLIKTLSQLQATGRALDMRFNLAELLAPHGQKIISHRYSPKNLVRSMLRSYQDWERLIRALPVQITGILDQAQTGKIPVQLQISGLDRITNRLILGLIATSLIVASAMMWSAGVGPMFDGFSLVGAMGIVLALSIVFRLWRAIARSGGL